MAHALIPQAFHRSQAPPPRSADFDSQQHLHLFGQQRVSLAGCSARSGSLCSHSAPALPKSLGNTKVKGRKVMEMRAVVSKVQTWPQITLAHLCLLSIGNSWPTFPAPDTLHPNELAMHCIHDSMHFSVPLPHKQLAFFFPDRRDLCNLLQPAGMGENQIWAAFDMRRPFLLPPTPQPPRVGLAGYKL